MAIKLWTSLSLLSAALFSSCALAQTVPVDCLTRTPSIGSLEDLASCFETYTVPKGYYTCATYDRAQPNAVELAGWNAAVNYILNADRPSCGLPPNLPISNTYNASLFVDGVTHDSYCVLYEKNAVTTSSGGKVFQRGWGTLIVQPILIKPLHFSIPHPLADPGVTPQAAIVFKRVVAKSLLMEGRHPEAVATSRSCNSAACTGVKADGARNVNEPFHQALLQIRSWQNFQPDGCPSDTCAYLQWHAKSSTTCLSDSTFLSSGIATPGCYADPSLPVNRIHDLLTQALPSLTHSTPANDQSCPLTAADNVFARVVNGVPEADVCTVGPSGCGGADFGQFVSIEQDAKSIDQRNWGAWSNVIQLAFS